MDDTVSALARAYAYAAARHAGQFRRGARSEPYINHLAEVAMLLAWATDGSDPVLVMGGVLHDVLEDTGANQAELATLFGAEVAELVAEVTDPPELDSDEHARRLHQVEAAPGMSDRARLLKIADKTSNIRERAQTPPPDKDDAEMRAYVEWGAAVVEGCRGLNERLEDAFDDALARALERFPG